MYIIALTGGIGSGKSEAAKQFAKLGIPIVDTDIIAHELTATGEPMLEEISRIFGPTFLTAEGTLNRAKLKAHVFDNPSERIKLEKLLHPAIYDRAIKQLHENEFKLQPPYQILVVPLLFENNRYAGVAQKTLVIDCDECLQVKRAMARGKSTESDIKSMMKAQVTRATRLSRADEVIENNGSFAELLEKVTEFHKKIIKTCIVSK